METKAHWLLLFTAAIWGFSWICGRIMSAEGIAPMHGAAARFMFGSAGLLALMLYRRTWPRPSGHLVVKLAGMGLFGVVLYNFCFFTGLRTVPAGRASLIASLQPALVFLASAIVWRERITVRSMAGVVISLTGAAVVLSQGDPSRLIGTGLNRGDLWVLGCAFSWAAYTLIGRAAAQQIPAVPATAYSTWIGTVALLALSFLEPPGMASWSVKAWLAAAFLGLIGTTLAFLFYLQAVARVGASRASIFINLVPVFGVLFSWPLLGELVGPASLLGGALVIAGVRLLNK